MVLLVFCQYQEELLKKYKIDVGDSLELDEVDRTILTNLREDSRMSLQEI